MEYKQDRIITNSKPNNKTAFHSRDIYRTKAGQAANSPVKIRGRSKDKTPHFSGFRKWLRNFSVASNPFTLIIVIIIVAAVSATVTAFIITNLEEIDGASVDETASAVEAAYSQNGYQGLLDEYQEQIDATSDTVEKASLYLERAADIFDLYTDNEVYDYQLEGPTIADPNLAETYKNQLLDDALKAEELNPSYYTANSLYQYYIYFGDAEQGSHFRQLAVDRQERVITGDYEED